MSPVKKSAAFTALIIALLSFHSVGFHGEANAAVGIIRHEIGSSAGIFNNSFIDDVISPVVYTGSSPIYEVFYRGVADEGWVILSLRYVSYTAGLRDVPSGNEFKLIDSEGEDYSLPRSMNEMDGSRVEFRVGMMVRIARSQEGRTGLYLGGNLLVFGETMKNYDYWSSTMGWEKDISQLSGLSLALTGKLNRRIRRADRLAIDLEFAVASIVERRQYYSPFGMAEDYDSDGNIIPETHGMLFYDYLNWSVQFSYLFQLVGPLGLEASYCFRHQRVNEPRDLRYVSQSMSLGVIYAFKGK